MSDRSAPLRDADHDAELFAQQAHCHELRVRIPTDVHRQLLALKILRGVTLAETVVLALDRYFAERGVPPPEGAPTRAEPL